VTTASRLKRVYEDMRLDYCGSWMDIIHCVCDCDAELVDSAV